MGQLQEIAAAALALPVRRALGSATAVVAGWQAAPLGGGIGTPLGGGGLHRVTGTARDGDASRSWSVVAKVLRPPATAGTVFGQPDPGAMFYWRREAHPYGSGLLDGVPAGFAVPRCYGIDEGADGTRLWREDVAETGGARWSLARYGEAARHLGRVNGASLGGRPLPEAPWPRRDRLRWRVPVVAPFGDAVEARLAGGGRGAGVPGLDRTGPLPGRARRPAAGALPRRRRPPQPARPRHRGRRVRDGGDRLGVRRVARGRHRPGHPGRAARAVGTGSGTGRAARAGAARLRRVRGRAAGGGVGGGGAGGPARRRARGRLAGRRLRRGDRGRPGRRRGAAADRGGVRHDAGGLLDRHAAAQPFVLDRADEARSLLRTR